MAANLQFVGGNRISYIKQLITGGTQPCRVKESKPVWLKPSLAVPAADLLKGACADGSE
jgi:hypothetical protein